MPPTPDNRLSQLEQDVLTLAQLVVKSCGMNRQLAELLRRRTGAEETRPHVADESRAA